MGLGLLVVKNRFGAGLQKLKYHSSQLVLMRIIRRGVSTFIEILVDMEKEVSGLILGLLIKVLTYQNVVIC